VASFTANFVGSAGSHPSGFSGTALTLDGNGNCYDAAGTGGQCSTALTTTAYTISWTPSKQGSPGGPDEIFLFFELTGGTIAQTSLYKIAFLFTGAGVGTITLQAAPSTGGSTTLGSATGLSQQSFTIKRNGNTIDVLDATLTPISGLSGIDISSYASTIPRTGDVALFGFGGTNTDNWGVSALSFQDTASPFTLNTSTAESGTTVNPLVITGSGSHITSGTTVAITAVDAIGGPQPIGTTSYTGLTINTGAQTISGTFAIDPTIQSTWSLILTVSSDPALPITFTPKCVAPGTLGYTADPTGITVTSGSPTKPSGDSAAITQQWYLDTYSGFPATNAVSGATGLSPSEFTVASGLVTAKTPYWAKCVYRNGTSVGQAQIGCFTWGAARGVASGGDSIPHSQPPSNQGVYDGRLSGFVSDWQTPMQKIIETARYWSNGYNPISYVDTNQDGSNSSQWTSTAGGSNFANSKAAILGAGFTVQDIFFSIGTADAYVGHSAATYKANLLTIVENYLAIAGVQNVFLWFPSCFYYPVAFAQYGYTQAMYDLLSTYLPVMAQVAATASVGAGQKVYAGDPTWYKASLQYPGNGTSTSGMTQDGLHPNSLGIDTGGTTNGQFYAQTIYGGGGGGGGMSSATNPEVLASPAPTNNSFSFIGASGPRTWNGAVLGAPVVWTSGANVNYRGTVTAASLSGTVISVVVSPPMPNIPSAGDLLQPF
jgi:hypothetical protein